MREIMTGNSAVVEGVVLCRPKVVTAYPITPQTTIVEEISKSLGGQLEAKFIPVESEHSAMASAAAAASCGVRVFTATSSHGLAFMHEMLSWVSGSRLPVVMVNVNRALGAPWSIWTEQTDSLMQRDTGWIQIYCASAQGSLDTIIQAYRLAEELSTPLWSATALPFLIRWSPSVPTKLWTHSCRSRRVMRWITKTLHVSHLAPAPHFRRFRHAAHTSVVSASRSWKRSTRIQEKVGRGYGLIETYRNEMQSSPGSHVLYGRDARKAVDILRDQGRR
jgi:hypothetical protein